MAYRERIPKSSPPAWVQVVFKDNEVVFDSVLEEFVQDIAWIWLPFVGILLVINLIVIRISLRPLARASAQASAIGPTAVSMRLSEAGMPGEVLSLVRAINHALDRLEHGYKEQQSFIADAAHELRTPVTIMTTHMDLLPEFRGKTALKEELGSLKRLVSQLLDNARIDALRIASSDQVELNTLAADVAAYLAPCTIASGKNIEVYRSERPAIVKDPTIFYSARFAISSRTASHIPLPAPPFTSVCTIHPRWSLPIAGQAFQRSAPSHIRALLARQPRPRRRCGAWDGDHLAHCCRTWRKDRDWRPPGRRGIVPGDISAIRRAAARRAHRGAIAAPTACRRSSRSQGLSRSRK